MGAAARNGAVTIADIIGIVLFWLLPVGALGWFFGVILSEHRRDRIPILLYHRLVSKEAAERGEVRDDEIIFASYDVCFAAQMEYLKEAGYTTLDFDDYLAIRRGERSLPERPVIITLDDGYLSNYRYAFPILKQHSQKATIFVALEPGDYTLGVIEGVDGFLTHEQIREMSDAGISIQSHTLTHCVLTEIDDAAARHELGESRSRLSVLTGRPVDHIAIPRAGYSPRVRRLVREAGYVTACCNRKGAATGASDLLALPRIVIERDISLEEFARALTPRTAAMLRIVGAVKGIPALLGGARLARRLRPLLYRGPLSPLFRTRNLKLALLVIAICYTIGGVLFTWKLLGS